MIEDITPLILTRNEAANIGRALEELRWAGEIIIVDSFSDDETIEIANSFPQVRIFQRKFDSHAAQWAYALNETGIATEWVLALDADYVLTPDYVEELTALRPKPNTRGYQTRFTYCINGYPLKSGVYPPVTVLYRKAFAEYSQDGHAQRLILDGEVEAMRSPILHDDRKPLSRWFESQQNYMTLEANKLLVSGRVKLGKADQIRRLRVVAPVGVLIYCLILRGGVLDGWPGFYYAFQRMLAELLLSLYLIEADFNAAIETRRYREQPTEAGQPKTVSSQR